MLSQYLLARLVSSPDRESSIEGVLKRWITHCMYSFNEFMVGNCLIY